MIRVIVDSQSNRLFRGIAMEQDYDQRGGLCQVGEGDVVITTNPIDPDYLKYWTDLGFSLPLLLTVGPFKQSLTLSELIANNPNALRTIRMLVERNGGGRIEFFTIEESEKQLCKVAGISPYCNFDLSIRLSRKNNFKQVCRQILLPTPPWIDRSDGLENMLKQAEDWMSQNIPLLIKVSDGTGGISCGGITLIKDPELLRKVIFSYEELELPYIIEQFIQKKRAEVSLHWEIDRDGNIIPINLFDQLSKNCSYAGVSYPSDLEEDQKILILEQLREKLGPYLTDQKALGFFCCDILIDQQGVPNWVDFNPRKGAILYVWDMIRRLSEIHFGGQRPYFWHEHLEFGSPDHNFGEIFKELSDLALPNQDPFVIVTNPGVFRYGFADITGVSLEGKKPARDCFLEAKARLLEFSQRA